MTTGLKTGKDGLRVGKGKILICNLMMEEAVLFVLYLCNKCRDMIKQHDANKTSEEHGQNTLG